MSDDRIRRAEREAERLGTPEARARLLRERLRGADLPRGWLETAARLGDRPARRVLGRFVPVLQLAELPDLLQGLEPARRVAALVRWGERLLPAWRAVRPNDSTVEALLQAGAAFAAAPGDATRVACRDALDACERTEPGYPQAGALLAVGAAMAACGEAMGHPAPRRRLEDAFVTVLGGATPDEAAAELRAALVPWALEGRGEPPAWPAAPEEDPALAARAAELEATFRNALARKDTKKAATAIRKAIRAKAQDEALVEAAADLGHPAAWLVARREGVPELRPPASVDELGERLEGVPDAYAAPVRRQVLARRHWVDRDGDAQQGWTRRVEPGELQWPEWGRRLLVRAALALAERALPRVQAASGAAAARPEEAVDTLRTFLSNPSEEEAGHVRGRGARVRRLAADLPDPRARAAAQVVAAACDLADRSQRAWNPGLRAGDVDLIAAVAASGEEPGPLWEDLRATLGAWALGADDVGSAARPYRATERFSAGETIEHPKFGVGRVEAVRRDRIDVAFADGTRTLVQAR